MDAKHHNNFGFLRLLFASLVIFSHSAELIDGNASREPLHRLFGTTTLGSLAVIGFFLISGYLITASLLQSKSIRHYMLKRVLRIYPGFIAASLICIFIFAPLSGGWGLIQNFSALDWAKIPVKLVTLTQPWVAGAFAGVKNPVLNGSMWTIKYEFLCYLSILLLVFFNAKTRVILCLSALSLFVFLSTVIANHDFVTAKPLDLSLHFYSKFLFAFSVGSLYYLFRDKIIWDKRLSLIAALLLMLALTSPRMADVGLILLGSYLLFHFSLQYKHSLLNAIGTKHDISYGVYLYAFPFQNLMIQHQPNISPWQLSAYTLVFTFIAGYVSWISIEKPFLSMKKPSRSAIKATSGP